MDEKKDIITLAEAEMADVYSKLTISNDFMFCHVLTDKNLSLGLVQRIFPTLDIRDIEFPTAQAAIRNDKDAKSIRLDVRIFEAGRERIFDLEMQTTNKKDMPKRSRYYLCQMDQDTLLKGCHYLDLPAAFIVFICTFDVFGRGRHIYTVQPKCLEEPDYDFQDGTTRMFLNTKGTQNDCSPELKAFLDYVDGKSSDDPYVQQVDKAVKIARQNPEWRRDFMNLYMRDLDNRREGIKEGHEKATNEIVQRLLSLNVPLETIVKASGMSLEDVRSLMVSC